MLMDSFDSDIDAAMMIQALTQAQEWANKL